MVNKCVAFGCKTGYRNTEQISTFRFPHGKPDLNIKWIKFVNRADWNVSKNSVLCVNHFEEKFITKGRRNTLNWSLNPVPTIHSEIINTKPSLLPTSTTLRKAPKERIYREDELPNFISADAISNFDDLEEKKCCPTGFQFKKDENYVWIYRIDFNETNFPSLKECIRIDRDLNVKLQHNGIPLPLPEWFINGHNAKLTRVSMLENFPSYIKNMVSENSNSILKELEQKQHFKPKGRPSFSAEIIRYSLLLRYTSAQAYKLLLEKFPFPSFSSLKRIQKGDINSITAAKTLLDKGKLSKDVILILDEMYLQKGTQFHGGDYVGANENGELYKGIMLFMISGLKETVPSVVKVCPEVTVTGDWLSQEIISCIELILKAGFNIRAVVADNHSSNVNAFKILLSKFEGDGKLFITLPESPQKIYFFFDTVHLLKNIRNSFVNRNKFVFPSFEFNISGHHLSSQPGILVWADIHKIFDKDKILDATLRKAPKLTFKALHPGDNKQNVNLAIAVFHETTIAASKSYFPERPDIANFLELIWSWWNIANSKQRYTFNFLNNAVTANDGKINFYQKLSDWIESWSISSNFCLTAQTSKAFVTTLRAQAMLMQERLNDGYEYVLTRRFQSDPLENRFSQYRQMSGGRFLVSLREVHNSERILTFRSLLKENVNIWDEDLKSLPNENVNDILDVLSEHESEMHELSLSSDSKEVAYLIAGYVAKKLLKRFNCDICSFSMIGNDVETNENDYLDILSRGGLMIPSTKIAEYICSCFAILDFSTQFIEKHKQFTTRQCAEKILETYSPKCIFTCEQHIENGYKFAIRIVTNIFYNNKQKLSSDEIRKDALKNFKKRQRLK